MVTFFTTAKPFRGRNAVVQRTAIKSWTLLRPRPEIILFGNEEGVEPLSRELGLRHVPDVARSRHGTPLLSDLFAKARHLASNPLLCYANADIIMMSDFMAAAMMVSTKKKEFLLTGRRWDIPMECAVDLTPPDWEERLRRLVKERGWILPPFVIDYFLFTRSVYGAIPPFAIGRTSWDGWLLYEARRRWKPVIDASAVNMVVHPLHDYSHVRGGVEEVYKGVEAQENQRFRTFSRFFCLADATHLLTRRGLQLNFHGQQITRHLSRMPLLLNSELVLKTLLYCKGFGNRISRYFR